MVNGTNYIFICTGRPATAHPETKLYATRIYTHAAHSVAPTVEVLEIKEVDVSKLVDGK